MTKCHRCGNEVANDSVFWDTVTPYCEACYYYDERTAEVWRGFSDGTSEGSMLAIENILMSAEEWGPETLDAIAEVVRKWASTWEDRYTV